MKRTLALVVGVVVLMLPGAALAAGRSSTCQAYNPQTCSTNANSTTQATTTSAQLPFTGLNVDLLVLAGGTLLGAGLVVRRLSRRLD